MDEKYLLFEKEKNLSPYQSEITSEVNYPIAKEITEYHEQKKRKTGYYTLITLSVFILFLAIVFCEVGIKLAANERDMLPSIILSEIFGGKVEDYDIRLSERLTASFLGVSKEKATAFALAISTKKEEAEETQSVKEPQNIPIDNLIEISEKETSKSEETENVEEEFPKHDIIKRDLSGRELGAYYIGNETGYSPDVKALLLSERAVPVFKAERVEEDPIVLILHTHGTEAYTDEGISSYIDDGSEISRSKDRTKNVVAIGAVMSEILNSKGIPTIHCEIMHDEESYQDSYNRASESIKNYLAKYPSIRYVFDVHRDAILTSDGSLVKTYTEIEGQGSAQLMTVAGSNYKGADFNNWEDNLSLALKLKAKLDSKYPGLSRPVYLRGAAYNLQYTKGSLLLEVGSSGNTLEEARIAAKYLAEALAELITGK